MKVLKSKLPLFWLLCLFFIALGFYINLQIDSRINHYAISIREEKVEKLRDYRRKLLLEYYVLFDYGFVEKTAITNLGYEYSGRYRDVRLIIE